MNNNQIDLLSKEKLIQLVQIQSEELKEFEKQVDAELEENRFIKSLGFIEGYPDFSDYFIRYFEDDSEGTAKKGSIFLGIFSDFVHDYGRENVLALLDEYMNDHF